MQIYSYSIAYHDRNMLKIVPMIVYDTIEYVNEVTLPVNRAPMAKLSFNHGWSTYVRW